MPMPTPNSGETRDDFMDRCMGDSVMTEDFPDSGQRAAVCSSQWDDRKGAGAMEYKTVAITDAESSDDGPGVLSGYGAVFGNVDSGGDVIIRGAFREALPDFVTRGFVPIGHNWMGLPIGTIDSAKEDDNGLYFEASYHSTASAQEARTVVRERLERGKFVGLSIGFLPDYDEGVEYDPDTGVRKILKIKELAEISIVTVPMNRLAGVTAAKDGLGAGLSYAEHGQRVLADLSAFVRRTHDRADYRTKEGRELSKANRERLAGIRDGLTGAAGDLDAILAATDPDREKALQQLARKRALLLHDIDFALAEAV
jgi:HK97 family phage prohead protease